MKRLFLAVVAMLSMTMAFAENEDANNVNNVAAYDMKVNIRKLGEVLGLTYDQMESVSDIHRTFCGEMMVASQANKDERSGLVKKAVTKDLQYMNYILNREQYRKYLMLLNATLNNRGLNTFAE
jgi:glutamine amidotransferase-like uncharacterized protein